MAIKIKPQLIPGMRYLVEGRDGLFKYAGIDGDWKDEEPCHDFVNLRIREDLTPVIRRMHIPVSDLDLDDEGKIIDKRSMYGTSYYYPNESLLNSWKEFHELAIFCVEDLN